MVIDQSLVVDNLSLKLSISDHCDRVVSLVTNLAIHCFVHQSTRNERSASLNTAKLQISKTQTYAIPYKVLCNVGLGWGREVDRVGDGVGVGDNVDEEIAIETIHSNSFRDGTQII